MALRSPETGTSVVTPANHAGASATAVSASTSGARNHTAAGILDTFHRQRLSELDRRVSPTGA